MEPVVTKQSGIQKMLWRVPPQEIRVVTGAHDVDNAQRVRLDQASQLPQQRYKPRGIRTAVLVSLIIFACALMGALGAASTKLRPVHLPASEMSKRDLGVSLAKRDMSPANAIVSQPIPTTIPNLRAAIDRLTAINRVSPVSRVTLIDTVTPSRVTVVGNVPGNKCGRHCYMTIRNAGPEPTRSPNIIEIDPELPLSPDIGENDDLGTSPTEHPVETWYMTLTKSKREAVVSTATEQVIVAPTDLVPREAKGMAAEDDMNAPQLSKRRNSTNDPQAPPPDYWMKPPRRLEQSGADSQTPQRRGDQHMRAGDYMSPPRRRDVQHPPKNAWMVLSAAAKRTPIEVDMPATTIFIDRRDPPFTVGLPCPNCAPLPDRWMSPPRRDSAQPSAPLESEWTKPTKRVSVQTTTSEVLSAPPQSVWMSRPRRDARISPAPEPTVWMNKPEKRAALSTVTSEIGSAQPKEVRMSRHDALRKINEPKSADAKGRSAYMSPVRRDADPTASESVVPSTSTAATTTSSSEHELVKIVELRTAGDVFIGSYLPTLVALVYAAIWSIVDVKVMRMEPFYQLSKPNGAWARDTITFSYFTCNTFSAPVYALYHQHWAVVCSSMAYLISSIIIPPIAADAVTITVSPYCTNPNFHGCPGVFDFGVKFSYALYSLIAFTIAMALCLVFLLWNRRTGVNADPSSIIGLATALNGNEVMHHLRQMDPEASTDDLKKDLMHRRYQLIQEQDFTPVSANSFKPTPEHEKGPSSPDVLTRELDRQVGRVLPQKPLDRRQVLRYGMITSAALFMGFVLGVIIWYWGNTEMNPLEVFMDSQSLGVRALWVLFGVIIKAFWQRIERAAQVSEPYVQLLKGQAHSRNTILVATASTPVESFVFAIRNRYYYLALISFMSFLAELLTILFPCIPYNDAELYEAFRATTFFCIAILSFMLLVLGWVVYRVHVLGTLPRSPETIAGQLSYLCGSNMMADYRDMKGLTGDRRDAMVQGYGKRYTFGWMPGVDGVSRWAIDEEHY